MHTTTMTQRFGVPALVAATFHVVLLFGIRPPITGPIGSIIPNAPPNLPPMPVELITPPAVEPEFSNEPVKSLGGPARPDAPDNSVPKGPIEIPITTTPTTPNVELTTNEIPKVWGPGGPGDATGVPIRNMKIFRSGDLDAAPRAKIQVSPEYPFALRSSGIEGQAMIEFDVDASGQVVSARALSGTQREFEDAAVRAVLKWRFEPGKRHGKAVPFRMVVPIGFTITRD